MKGIGKEGEHSDGESFEGIDDIRAWVFDSEFLDGAETATGEDIAQIYSARRNGVAGCGAADGAVLAGGEAVEKGKIIQQRACGAILGEVVIEVIDASGIGAAKNAIGGELGRDIGLVDAIRKVSNCLEFWGGGKRFAAGLKALSGGWGEGNDRRREFSVEGDRASGHPDDRINVSKISTGELVSIESEGVRWGEFFCGSQLFGFIGGLDEKNSGEPLHFLEGNVGRQNAVELGKQNNRQAGLRGLDALGGGQVLGADGQRKRCGGGGWSF